MSLLKHLYGDIEPKFMSLISCWSATISEIFSYPACRQLSQMIFAIFFFHISEFIIAIAIHGKTNEHWWISNTGLLMVIIGEVIRKLAIVTAGRSFTHLIRIHHEEHHKLVTHGVYAYVRHPSYCGFFIWSLGTQIMLCNPLSALAFALVVWRFFQQRIRYEEFFLRQFFGIEYEEYATQTYSGIPFLK
ncbi:unnamed protein product [Fraxinus pennsylvanica]|uniref:Protein-S-isoprenylcysteine O-methyltransferase n=1 Tax=Fraxinus pennsylvanica TaxID=56036 RepID=A0AAD2EAT4_9LAMI|nr:unnamed protein product [Fraxinus pennsylvanica]